MPLRLVDDTAYGAGWNGVAGLAPSQNAVYDAVEARAGLVTVADEAADTTSFPLFATSATGSLLSIKSNAGLTFNAATATLGVTGLTVTNDATINGLRVGRGLLAETYSTAVGQSALGASATGAEYNTAIGASSGAALTTGGYNTLVGAYAGYDLLTGLRNVMIGSSIEGVTSKDRNVIIGHGIVAQNADFQIVIGSQAVSLGGGTTVIGSSSSSVFRAWGTPTFGGTNSLTFSLASLTAARTATMPDASGTMTLLGNTSTGSGSVVLATSPTLVTPVLGVATATTLNKVTVTQPATSSTLTIQDGYTLTASGNSTINQDVSTTGTPQFAKVGVGTTANANAAIIASRSVTDPASSQSVLNLSSTTNSITAHSPWGFFGTTADVRINQNGFNLTDATGGVRGLNLGVYATGASGTVTSIAGQVVQASNTGAGTLTTGSGFVVAAAQNSGGGTYTNNIGFNVMAQTNGTNIYGFRGQIAAASGRWNVYMDGTAANYLAGTLQIGHTGTALGQFEVRTTSGPQAAFSNTANEWLGITVGATGTCTYDIATAGTPRHVFADRINIPTSTPASASATGTTGDIAWDASYIYVCTATNTWKRVAIATW